MPFWGDTLSEAVGARGVDELVPDRIASRFEQMVLHANSCTSYSQRRTRVVAGCVPTSQHLEVGAGCWCDSSEVTFTRVMPTTANQGRVR